MMEYLDYYDENGNYLGYATRDEVHQKGLWHNTVHNWLYTKNGKVAFQIRHSRGKLYTTSSGHVDKGESIEEAFKRETKEEIGLNIDASNAKLIGINTWIMDKEKDGNLIKDRAKAHVFIAEFDENRWNEFSFDENEVDGIALVDAKDTLKLFKDELNEIDATFITTEGKNNIKTKKKIKKDAFLIQKGENQLEKYGEILKSVIKELGI